MRFKGFLVAAALMGLMATAVRADTLKDLIDNGGTIIVGDKAFSNFGYLPTGDMPSADEVNVVGITSVLGNYGIRFQGGFGDLAGGGSSDALITYRVTVLDPGFWITDAHLDSNLVVIPPGIATGQGTITETFTAVVPPVPSLAGTMVLNYDFQPGGPTKVADSVVFGRGYRVLDVQKDIELTATTGTVSLSFVDQTFSQAVVPLPAAAWASFGMLGLLGLVRMRKAWR